MPKKPDYRESQIMTSSPMQLVMMLYDEAIKALKQAEEGFELEGPARIESVNNSILHAQDVITELLLSLDMEKGGDIAINLERLYDFMINHLSTANVNKDSAPMAEVRELLCELREAWQQVAQKEPGLEERGVEPQVRTNNISIPG